MSRWQAALRLVGVGGYVVICIILGVLGGRWLDKELDTRFMIMVGLLAGVGLAFYGVYRMILPNINKKQNKGKS